MKKQKERPVIMIEDDYRRLLRYADKSSTRDSMSLAHELDRAIIVLKSTFPRNAVRLNSLVSVMDLKTKKVMEFTIVMPEEADKERKKISVLSPMGTALIGYRKAEEVKWRFASGLRKIKILEVVNQAA